MPSYKTPDVYIEEISVFPPSVAQVETAIPAFIGYTEQAIDKAINDLVLKPTKIYSLKEYERYYGYPKADTIALSVVNDPIAGFAVSDFTEPALRYLLYYSVKMFFDNGGGQCYIIAVGTYQNTPAIDLQGDTSADPATMYGLQDGLEALGLEDEPTLIVIPEAVELTPTDYQSLVQAVLLQCNRLGDRFAIFDIFDGDRNLNTNQLSTNRAYFGNNYLKYGAAYYPFLRTTMNFYVNETGIASLSLTAGGSGYTTAPTVTITGGGGTGATATATVAGGVVTGLNVTASGSGYTTAPTVTITGGGGSGATASAAIGETNITVVPPQASGATAIATLAPGAVGTIAVTAGGTGYTSAPTVTLTGGGGSGATATAALIATSIASISLTTGGTGYTSNPTVSLTGGGGTGATATATLSPASVATIGIDNGGTGYTSAPTVTLTGGGGSAATATATVAGGAITAITVNNGGTGYTSAPTVSFTGGGGTGAAATATLSSRSVATINLTAPGTGYTSPPTVNFTGGSGSGVAATAGLQPVAIASISVTAGGTGYTSAPTVTITGGGGSGAIASAALAGRTLGSISVTAGGTGYTSAPTVTITGGGGSGATATATVSGGAVNALSLTAAGSGYTSAPTITLSGGSSLTPVMLAGLKTSNTGLYNFVKNALKERFVVLPPSGAVTGIYAATDSNRGVWKAPANISLTNVIEPVIKLDNTKQDDLNVDASTGKSINAIRSFMGKGTLVWGARTLAGNDNEWRYIPVRRFFNMVEESVKKSTYWAVFEPNDANTWVKVRGMIENFLNQQWREGALAGATPKDAFFVKCGLGITMTSQDILEGRMNVEIGMAVVRPAEFIILKFSHKLQTS